jgi:hypothetical protein
MATASPSRTRKSAAKKTVAAPRTAAVPQDFEPIELTTEQDTNEESLVHLFSVNGEKYFVSNAQDVGLALQYLKRIRTEGQELAMLWLFETLLTGEAFDALVGMRRLKPESLAKVAGALQKILLGGMDAPKA